MTLDITLWTDPACPIAFSAEPVRWRLRWLYGDQLRWTPRMIVLTREDGHAELLAAGAPGLQKSHGMPIDPQPLSRPASSEAACRAVVATRLYAPDTAERLLRALRVRAMVGELLDEPEVIAAAAQDAGLDPRELESWSLTPETATELERDVTAAHEPSTRARALDHKLGGPSGHRRYSAPSYELRSEANEVASVPGLNPAAVYETVIANLDPALARRAAPDEVSDVLAWADQPLATAEVAEIMGIELDEARAALAETATEQPAGADAYWVAR